MVIISRLDFNPKTHLCIKSELKLRDHRRKLAVYSWRVRKVIGVCLTSVFLDRWLMLSSRQNYLSRLVDAIQVLHSQEVENVFGIALAHQLCMIVIVLFVTFTTTKG